MGKLPTVLLKDGAHVPGTSCNWEANISNDELLDVYVHLKENTNFFQDLKPPPSMDAGPESDDWLSEIEVKLDCKTYRIVGTTELLVVAYLSDADWAIIDEKGILFSDECLEHESEYTHKDSVIGDAMALENAEGFMYPPHTVNGYKERGDKYFSDNNFEEAENNYLAATNLLEKHGYDSFVNDRGELVQGYHLIKDIIMSYVNVNRIPSAMEFIRNISPSDLNWLILGQELERVPSYEQAIEVYKEALNDHFTSSRIRQRLALVLERNNDLTGAIEFCKLSIENGISEDGTMKGFAGRLERLKKKYEKSAEDDEKVSRLSG